MREIRLHGSEGGGTELIGSPYLCQGPLACWVAAYGAPCATLRAGGGSPRRPTTPRKFAVCYPISFTNEESA
jgi:hypothetical protein